MFDRDGHLRDRYQPVTAIHDDYTAAVAILQLRCGLCDRKGWQDRLQRLVTSDLTILDVSLGYTDMGWGAPQRLSVHAAGAVLPHDRDLVLLGPRPVGTITRPARNTFWPTDLEAKRFMEWLRFVDLRYPIAPDVADVLYIAEKDITVQIQGQERLSTRKWAPLDPGELPPQ